MGITYGLCNSPDSNLFDNQFLECLKDCLFFQHVVENTRQRGSDAPSLLDLIITNEEGLIDKLEFLSPLGKSDHSVIGFDIICEEECQPPSIKSVYEKGNYHKFEQEMKKINWVDELENFKNDVEGQWNFFKDKYKK